MAITTKINHFLAGRCAWLIALYQRYLSPRKGYCCAYAQATGADSCSETVKQQFLQQGLAAGLRGFPQQLQRCKQAANQLNNEGPKPLRKKGKRKCCSPADACAAADCSFVSCTFLPISRR